MRLFKAFIALILFINLSQLIWSEQREPYISSGLVGARSIALAGNGCALPGSPEILFANPATLVFLDWPEVAFGLGNHDLGDQQLLHFSGSIPLLTQCVLGVGILSVSNPIQADQTLESYLFSLAFALSPNGKLLLGLSGKFLQQPLPGIEGRLSGGGMDIGLLYSIWETEDYRAIRLGMALIDAQTRLKSESTEYTLPSIFRLGLTWQIEKNTIATIEFDSLQSQIEAVDNSSVLRLGVEHTIEVESLKGLATRLGYNHQLDQEGVLAAGVGVAYDDWRLDYAFQVPLSFKFGMHQLGLSWGFGRTEQRLVRVEEIKKEDHQKKKKSSKQAEEIDVSMFSALDSAAESEEEFEEFESDQKSDFEEDEESYDEEETIEEETQVAYNIPVPEGPAAQESVSLGADLEMPASFSGYFNNAGSRRYSSLKIVEQDIRLHAVVNPFSPNGDGKQDKTIFVGRLVNDRLRVDRWRLYILQAGNVVRQFRGGSRMPRNLEWDGRNEKGKKLDDGKYEAIIRVLDENGMELAAATQTVEIRTKTRAVKLTGPERVRLSGGASDKALQFKIPKMIGSSNWRFMIYSPSGRRVFDKSGGSQVPTKMAWKPRVRRRAPAAGRYRVVLRYQDEIGLKAKTETSFKVTYAQFSTALSASPSLFKPQKQGGKGVVFDLKTKGKVVFKTWVLQIVSDNKKKTVRSFKGKGTPPSTITWDGLDESGKVVQGGDTFIGRLLVSTNLGTKAAVDSDKVQCDIGEYTGKKALAMNLVRALYAPGKTNFNDKTKKALASAAETVKQYKMDYQMQITGHADKDEGQDALALSRKRAKLVADYLVQQAGIPQNRIQVVGKGSQQRMIKEGTVEQRKRNRRVEVKLFAK